VVAEDPFNYNEMIEQALRGVVREALQRAAQRGLSGGHYFYLTFRTRAPGVELPDYLLAQYPDLMTVVLQHQFWGLEVGASAFSVTLSFSNQPQRLKVPFDAVTAFADPSVKFALQFEVAQAAGLPARVPELTREKPPRPAVAGSHPRIQSGAGSAPEQGPPAAGAEVVALDQFRKR
jgi:uncharacterized protein